MIELTNQLLFSTQEQSVKTNILLNRILKN